MGSGSHGQFLLVRELRASYSREYSRKTENGVQQFGVKGLGRRNLNVRSKSWTWAADYGMSRTK